MNKCIKNKYKKIIVILCILMNCFILSSCFSYKDINRILFVTALMVDVDEEGKPVLYCEAFRGVRATTPEGMDERVLFKGSGKTVFEAVRDMNAAATFKLNYTQNKAIIFTQKAAENGIGDFLDFLDRDQELLVRPYISVFTGDMEKLIKLKVIQEKYIGLLIVRIIENIGASSRSVTIRFNDFYNQRTIGDKTSVVTIIEIKKDSLDSKLEISGGAVIKNDRMVARLEREDGQGFNFLMNNVNSGTLEITNPCDINKFVTLEIKGSKTKTEAYYYDNIFHLKKKIKVNVDFGEAQKEIIFTKENIKKIEEKAADNIEKACSEVFNKFKDMSIDIFDLEQVFHEKYPKIKAQDVINRTELQLEVEVEIMNTGDVRNFQ